MAGARQADDDRRDLVEERVGSRDVPGPLKLVYGLLTFMAVGLLLGSGFAARNRRLSKLDVYWPSIASFGFAFLVVAFIAAMRLCGGEDRFIDFCERHRLFGRRPSPLAAAGSGRGYDALDRELGVSV